MNSNFVPQPVVGFRNSGYRPTMTTMAEGAPVRRGRGRPRDPGTDSRITRAAAELMLQRGFEPGRVGEAASHAGVGKAGDCRRWPSKEDLAGAAMESLYPAEMHDAARSLIRHVLA